MAAVEDLKTRALSQNVSETERKKALVALAFIKNKKAADAMTNVASVSMKEVGEDAAWWLNFRKTNDWIDLLVSGDKKKGSSPAAVEVSRRKMLILQAKMSDPKTPSKEKLKAVTDMAIDPAGGQLLIDLASSKNFLKKSAML